MTSLRRSTFLKLTLWTAVGAAASIISAAPVHAGPIDFGTFYQFSFAEAGSAARGCDPADPAGDFCLPSSGTVTEFLDAPPWTFVAPSAGVRLAVIDAFTSGDRFEIFDFGVSLGLTLLPGVGGDCGDDPVPCLADPAMSKGLFTLAAGDHSITIVSILSPDNGGSAYLRATAVPEPATITLLGGALAALGALKRRRKTRV